MGEWQASDSEMVTALKKVLKKARAKRHKLKSDFGRELNPGQAGEEQAVNPGPGREEQTADSPETFHVLALPFIPRQLYLKVWCSPSECSLWNKMTHSKHRAACLCRVSSGLKQTSATTKNRSDVTVVVDWA